jgi:hypothetical protein
MLCEITILIFFPELREEKNSVEEEQLMRKLTLTLLMRETRSLTRN